MDGREIEPRLLMWAVAEISWRDDSGEQLRAPATIEDTSKSGACVRVKRPLAVGSMVTIRWHREQFSGVARNCRRDGRDFLVGVRREARGMLSANASAPTEARSPEVPQSPGRVERHPLLQALHAERERRQATEATAATSSQLPKDDNSAGKVRSQSGETKLVSGAPPTGKEAPEAPPIDNVWSAGAVPHRERKDMQPKTFLPSFLRRAKGPKPLQSEDSKEVVVSKANERSLENGSVEKQEMLSYEDIYRAAGIMNPASGYGIHKVVDMLNSERIRDLSKDVQRASVLMALDVSGTSVDDVLTDAKSRQEALERYEAGKKKQIEDFEAAKTRDNSQLEQEMERIKAHYAERMQHNRDLIAQEKETLRTWQMAMQHEMKRIAEVIELCGHQPASPYPEGKTSAESTPDHARAAAVGRSN